MPRRSAEQWNRKPRFAAGSSADLTPTKPKSYSGSSACVAQGRLLQPEQASTAIGCSHAEPGIPNLVIVHRWIIDLSGEPENVRSEPANRRKQRIRGNHPLPLDHDQGDPRIQQVLYREQLERAALAGTELASHRFECELGRSHLSLRRIHAVKAQIRSAY